MIIFLTIWDILLMQNFENLLFCSKNLNNIRGIFDKNKVRDKIKKFKF